MGPKPSPPTALFVRGLSPQATKADLSGHFSGVGPLRRTLIVTDAGTGLCKGFGFVYFALAEDAAKALRTLDGSLLRGRRISIDTARPRDRSGADEDADGGLAPRHSLVRDHEKKKKPGALKGSAAMRTVLLVRRGDDDKLFTEEEARAVFSGCEDVTCQSVVLSAEGNEARCMFASWAEAGRAAAAAHSDTISACVEALRENQRARLIMRNLPFKVRFAEVRDAFSKVAPVRELKLAPPRNVSGISESQSATKNDGHVSCAGFGFIEYFLVADAKFALQKLNGAKIGGRVIAVDMAMDRSTYIRRIGLEEQEEQRENVNIDHDSSDEVDAGEEEEDDNPESADTDSELDAEIADSDRTKSGQKSALQHENAARPVAKRKPASSTSEEMARTVFVRNMLYETSAPELWKAMESEFGRVEQAVLVVNPLTRRPRGSGFVRFAKEEDANSAVERASSGDTSKSRSAIGSAEGKGFMLQGRSLMLSKAVNRKEAKDLSQQEGQKRKKDDPRNSRLAWVGEIKPGTPQARGLSELELARREKSAKDKKTKLERNPNAFISDKRLSVRNLPRDVDEKTLKHMFLVASREVSELKAKETSQPKPPLREIKKSVTPRITHCTIVRDPDRNERSKGYGFVEFERHEDALAALHATNNNPKVIEALLKASPKVLKIDENRARLLRKQWGDGRRLQVEFSVEDKRKVQILERVKEKGQKMKEANILKKRQGQDSGEGDSKKSGKESKKKRKRGKHSVNEDQVGRENKELSKSERKSALKRKRAEIAEEQQSARTTVPSSSLAQSKMSTVHPTGSSKRQRTKVLSSTGLDANSSKRTQRPARQDTQAEFFAKEADAKPRKPKRKRKSAEVEQGAKWDALVRSYRQKLEKGANRTGSANATRSGPNVEPSAISRWFE